MLSKSSPVAQRTRVAAAQPRGVRPATTHLPATPVLLPELQAQPSGLQVDAVPAMVMDVAVEPEPGALPVAVHDVLASPAAISAQAQQWDTQCLVVDPHSFPWSPQPAVCSTPAASEEPRNSSAPHMQGRTTVIDLTALPSQPAAPQPSSSPPDLAHIQHDGLQLHRHARPPTATYAQDLRALQQAADTIQQGLPVAIPTETVYGLAADALSAESVRAIYAAKNRPADNPLIVHISSLDMLYSLYPSGWTLPEVYREVVATHWPGPLTILLPTSDKIPAEVVCGQPTVAVRMPSHPVARALIALSGRPLAAPSANSSGRPSPTTAQHVVQDLAGRIPLVLDGGPCGCGVESTVLDGLRQPPVVLRPGGVTVEQLSRFTHLQGLLVYRKHFVDAHLEEAPTTPGMKYRHYSPRAPITLLDLHAHPGSTQQARAAAAQQVVALVQDAVREARQAHANGPSSLADGRSDARHECAGKDAVGHGGHTCMHSGRPVRVGVLRTSKCAACPPGLTQGNQAHAYCLEQGPGPAGEQQQQHAGQACQVEVLEYVLGDLDSPGDVARELFAALRLMDDLGVGWIVAEGVREAGEGLAVMNRLRKAATHVVPLN